MSAITDSDATQALFDSCQGVSPTPLFNDRNKPIDSNFRHLFDSLHSVRTSNPGKLSAYRFSHLPTQEQFVQFCEALRQLPEAERQFKLLPSPSKFPHLNTLLSKMGLNGFHTCSGGDMVPSFGMMQALLKVKSAVAPMLNPNAIIAAPTLNRVMLARLHLSYALLTASTTEPEVEIKKQLATVRVTSEMLEDLVNARQEMPQDPLLQLLAQSIQLSSKL